MLVLAQNRQGFTALGTFAGDRPIESAQLAELNLTAAQLFKAGDLS